MNSRLKWVSSLTLLLIIAFIISIGLLTYFSIDSISNLKKVTEKNIIEEQDNLHKLVLDSIRKDFESITIQFEKLMTVPGFKYDTLRKLAVRFPYMFFPFKYDSQGNFLCPYYKNTLDDVLQEDVSRIFCRYYQKG